MMTLAEDRDHFSHNQLLAMLSCPYKYYLQYVIRREWDMLPSAISFGSAIHESIKSIHIALQNGGLNSKDGFIDLFKETFSDSSINVAFKDSDEFGELMAKGQELVSQYIDTFGHIKPMEVEMEFRLPMVNTYTGDMIEKDVVGRMDLITNADEIYELKTGSSAMPEYSASENLQLILYGWAYKMLYGKSPQKLILINMVKSKKPKIQVLETMLDPVKEQKLLHLMFSVNEAIQKECFYPNPKGGFGCNNCCYSLSCEYAF
jgi:CRISPR/Cas system-associated exonuclease Cas4 (RecB family)